MRLLLPIAFCIGLVLKLLHLPFHTIVLLAVLAVGLIWSLVQLLRGTDKAMGWTTLAVWAWAAHLVAVLKLFPFRSATLGLAIALGILALVSLLRQRPIPAPPLRSLTGIFIVVMLVMAAPPADRYHFTNLRFSLEQESDYRTWDKYSFFLAREGRTAEALQANGQAMDAARKGSDTEAIPALQERRALIEGGSWIRYHVLGNGPEKHNAGEAH